MSKLTQLQKERLFQLVSIGDAQGFTTEQIAQFVTETLGTSITPSYVTQVKRKMRNESYSWLTKMKSSKDHYIYEFKKRVDEVTIARSMFFKLYSQTQSDLVKLGCIRGILKAAEDMSELYGVLPLIGGGLGAAANNNINLVRSSRNNDSNSNVFGPKEISSISSKQEEKNDDLPV
jgi:hypothetical protein